MGRVFLTPSFTTAQTVPGEPGAVRKPYVPYKAGTETRQLSNQAIQPVSVGISVIGTDEYPDVDLFLNVGDGDGRPIGGLAQVNFRVSEQGVPIDNIQVDQPSTAEPLAVVLVIDRSGSMDLSTNPDCNPPIIDQCPIPNACPDQPIRLDRAQEAANAFVANLQGADRAALVTFSGDARVDVGLTSNKADLVAGIEAIETVCEGTAIYDATIFGVQELTGVEGIRAVVLVSDGGDNSSSRTNAEAIEFAKANRVPIYTIAYGEDIPAEDLARLRELAEFTGGQFHEAPSNEDLAEFYVRIGETIRGQYRIRYTAPNVLGTGETRTVIVTADVNGFTATASASYRFARELTLGVPENFDVGDVTWLYNLEVPEGAENLFVLLQKTTTTGHGWQPRGYGSYGWEGTMTVLREGQALGADVGYRDFAIHIPHPPPGRYTVEVTSETPGAGILTARTSLPELALGEWTVGTILRSWGSAWFQLEVPPGIETLFFKVEALGVWSPLDVYQGVLRRGLRRTSAGERLELMWPSPDPGTYFVEFTDSAIILTANDQAAEEQERDFLIRIDTAPILGPPPGGPVITRLSTYVGGNSGQVTVAIHGAGLDPNAQVALHSDDGPTVFPEATSGATDRQKITARFDLSAVSPGERTLTVTNSDGQRASSQNPFSIREGGQFDIWVEILGRQTLRVGRPQTYTVRYGNRGTIDAPAVPLWIAGIPTFAHWRLDVEVTPPIDRPNDDPIDWSEIPYFIQTDDQVVIPLVVALIPAGFSGDFNLSLTAADDTPFELRAWVNPPLLATSGQQGTTTTSISSGDGRHFLDDLIDCFINSPIPIFIPWVDCARAILQQWQALEEEYREFGENTFWSIIWNFVRAAGQCIQEGNPVSKIRKTLEFLSDVVELVLADELIPESCKDVFKRISEALRRIIPVRSATPEDKYGASHTDGGFVGVGVTALYRIDFWNKEDATASAQDVFVEDQLDKDLDWMTFNFTEFGFLRWKVELEGGQYFNVRVDLRPDMNLLVNVEGTFDIETGKINWTFRSLDPDTLEPPEDPLAGFLPPITDSGYEIGWVEFTVRPKTDLRTGTQITNQALVNFDGVGPWNKAPKDPPEGHGPWLNTIDAGAPTSRVLPLDSIQADSAFTVEWNGQDDEGGSGVGSFTIYVARDQEPYSVWLSRTPETSGTYTGEVGRTYKFFSTARDNVGNEESPPSADSAPHAVTTISAPLCGACGTGTPTMVAGTLMFVGWLRFRRGHRKARARSGVRAPRN